MTAALLLGLVLSQPGPLAYDVRVPGDIVIAPALAEGLNWEMAHPVSLPLPVGDDGLWALVSQTEGERMLSAAQTSALGPWGNGGRWIAFVLGMETSPTCRLERVGIAEELEEGPAYFAFETTAEGVLQLTDGGVPVLDYVEKARSAPGLEPRLARADYIHPLCSPSGTILTEDFPADHLHQSGLFWRWATVTWDGGEGGPWELTGMHPRWEESLGQEVGPVCAVYGARSGWYTGVTADDPAGVRIVEEDLWVRVWRATGAGRRVDVVVSLRACVPGVRIEGREDQAKGYGGFSIRIADSDERQFVTSEGPLTGDALGMAAEWVDCSQRDAEGKEAGVTIWTGSEHPAGSPTDWFLRQYGAWCVRWPGLASAEVSEGAPLTLEHHLWLHDGDASDGSAPLAYASWKWTNAARMREAE